MLSAGASSRGTLLLSRGQVASLLPLTDCIDRVEAAFRLLGEARAAPAQALELPAAGGAFHVKAALLDLGRPYAVVKTNANFSGNPDRGLPTIQGAIVLADGADGRPLAILDSAEITALRTGAATAVAARRLARADARAAAICGCGVQGRIQLRALAAVLPLERAFAWDPDPDAAGRLAAELGPALGIDVRAVATPAAALAAADVAATCTPATAPFVGAADLRPGLFLAAVGADAPHKRELEGGALAASRVVVDALGPAARQGELHHALVEGRMTLADVHGELGAVVAGRAPGRTRSSEVFVFDSTGSALLDAAAAGLAYERGRAAGVGTWIDLGR